MSQIYSNIDIAQLEALDQFQYHLEGWVLSENGEYPEITVCGDDQEPLCSQVQFHEREDIAKAFVSLPVPEKPGLTICIHNVREILQSGINIHVYAECNGSKKCIFIKSVDELRKEYAQQDIHYNIDRVDFWRDQIIIQGWVYDIESLKTVDVSLIDEESHPVKGRIERVIRLDLGAVVDLPGDCKSGFNISVKRSDVEAKVLCVQFGDTDFFCVYQISMDEFDARYSKKGRLKNALKDKEVNKKIIREEGLMAFIRHLKYEMDPWYADYNMWVQKHEVTVNELMRQRKRHFPYEPLVSIIIPLYNTPIKFLQTLMQSLVNQSYQKIEICLADGSTNQDVEKFIRRKYGRDSRVRYKKLEENKGISENTNAALQMSSGEYIMLSDHDDLVTKDAVYQIVKAINRDPENNDVIYTDEDKVTMNGKDYFEPNMKPDFNLDFLRSNNYICHIFVVRKSIMDQIGGFRSEFDGAQDYDLILRCCELARNVVHVPRVLYHWRSHPASTAENPESKLYAVEAGRKALQMHYDRMGIEAKAEATDIFGRYRTRFAIHGEPEVSIIIPNKDHIDDLKKCLESIWEKTTYKNYQIFVVENNSVEKDTFRYYEMIEKLHAGVHIIHWKDEFNYAAINNYAVNQCTGEYLLFLNNDTEIITPEWIEEMLAYAQRQDVGAVGAKLYYPDDTVQHAGVVIGLGGIAGHIFSGTPRVEYGYQARLISPQNYSAVTAACMMVRRDIFEQVEGFDERYKVAFNDVDLCMKIRSLDKLIVFTPYAELYHYESKSRGAEETKEKMERFHNEIHLFEEKWPEILKKGDPYYNRNLSLEDGNCLLRKE